MLFSKTAAWTSSLIGCALALIWGAAWAVESEEDLTRLPLESLMQREVQSASRMARQVSDSPSAVAIVTAEEIRAYGYRTIADVINSMRGLYTTSDRNYTYMGGRGFGKPDDFAGRIMVMIDGHPTQDGVFSQAFIDQSGLLDMEIIERVEYVPGTGSVTYGNNAMLGIINIVTKKGRDFNGAQLSGEWFSGKGERQRVTYGRQFESGTDLLLSVSQLRSDGNRSLYFPEYQNSAVGMDGEKNDRFFAKLTHGGFTLEAAQVNRKKDVPTAPRKYTALNLPYRAWDESAYVTASYETDLALDLKSSTRFYHASYANKDFFAYDQASYTQDYADGVFYRQNNSRGSWSGVDQKFVLTGIKDHVLVLGSEFRVDHKQNYVKGFLDANYQPLSSQGYALKRNTFSLYAEDALTLDPHWQLVTGLRHDQTSDSFAHTSPRLALIHTPSERTTIKLSHSEAFRLPNAYDKFWAQGDYAAAPEYVSADELVLQHQLDQRTRFTATAYHYRISGLVYLQAARWLNDGHARTNGLEAEIERNGAGGHRLRTSLAWQHAIDYDNQRMANSPDLLGKFNYSLPLWATNLRGGIEAQYLGRRLTVDTRQMLGGTGVLNLTLSTEQKWHGLSAVLSVRNVFDNRYLVPANFQKDALGNYRETLRMDGRTFWLQVSYDL